jgi:hypothetical protein
LFVAILVNSPYGKKYRRCSKNWKWNDQLKVDTTILVIYKWNCMSKRYMHFHTEIKITYMPTKWWIHNESVAW